MRRLCEPVANLVCDDGFLAFQKDLTQDLYLALSQGYASSDNEVALVERLVDAVNSKSYGPVRLFAKMLHGSRSYVEFNYMDKPVTKEMGDMALITVVTSGGERLLQKLSIVQNKKSKGQSWGLDLEQLFLLKNFPRFAGNKGIFRGCRDVTFRNNSRCLGSFGLLKDPGEMVYASAHAVADLVHGKQSLSFADLTRMVPNGTPAWGSWDEPFFHPGYDEIRYRIARYVAHRMGSDYVMPFAYPWDYLATVRYAPDLHDLVRSWTQLSIGEITCASNVVVSPIVDAFANLLVRAAGLADIVHIPGGWVALFQLRRQAGELCR